MRALINRWHNRNFYSSDATSSKLAPMDNENWVEWDFMFSLSGAIESYILNIVVRKATELWSIPVLASLVAYTHAQVSWPSSVLVHAHPVPTLQKSFAAEMETFRKNVWKNWDSWVGRHQGRAACEKLQAKKNLNKTYLFIFSPHVVLPLASNEMKNTV